MSTYCMRGPGAGPQARSPREEVPLVCCPGRRCREVEGGRLGGARAQVARGRPPAPRPHPAAAAVLCGSRGRSSAPCHLLSRLFAASCASYNFSFLSPQGLSFASPGPSAPFWSGQVPLPSRGGRLSACVPAPLPALAPRCPPGALPLAAVSTWRPPSGGQGCRPGRPRPESGPSRSSARFPSGRRCQLPVRTPGPGPSRPSQCPVGWGSGPGPSGGLGPVQVLGQSGAPVVTTLVPSGGSPDHAPLCGLHRGSRAPGGGRALRETGGSAGRCVTPPRPQQCARPASSARPWPGTTSPPGTCGSSRCGKATW